MSLFATMVWIDLMQFIAYLLSTGLIGHQQSENDKQMVFHLD
jgi:hypothetical protein